MHKNDSAQNHLQKVNSVTLDFIRHGEPEGGTMYRGSQDDPLSNTGWKQLRSSTHQAKTQGVEWSEIITSPMQRCNAFANRLSQELNLPLSKETSLRELAFGDLEGMTPEAAWKQYPELLAAMWKNPENHTPPNGEPFDLFCDRVQQSIQTIIKKRLTAKPISQHLLLVVHGGVIRAMLHRLFSIAPGATFQFDVPFASITRIVAYTDLESTNPNAPFTVSLKFMNGILPQELQLQSQPPRHPVQPLEEV